MPKPTLVRIYVGDPSFSFFFCDLSPACLGPHSLLLWWQPRCTGKTKWRRAVPAAAAKRLRLHLPLHTAPYQHRWSSAVGFMRFNPTFIIFFRKPVVVVVVPYVMPWKITDEKYISLSPPIRLMKSCVPRMLKPWESRRIQISNGQGCCDCGSG